MEFDGELDGQFAPEERDMGWAIAATIAGVALLIVLGIFVTSALGADAMATCQLTHSFDTCFAARVG